MRKIGYLRILVTGLIAWTAACAQGFSPAQLFVPYNNMRDTAGAILGASGTTINTFPVTPGAYQTTFALSKCRSRPTYRSSIGFEKIKIRRRNRPMPLTLLHRIATGGLRAAGGCFAAGQTMKNDGLPYGSGGHPVSVCQVIGIKAKPPAPTTASPFSNRAVLLRAKIRDYVPSMTRSLAAIFPGSFDPITNGHLDLIERGSRLFDTLVVAVLKNETKQPLFTIEDRVEMLREAIGKMSNVEIDCFDGLLVKYAAQRGARVILRGIRAISDYEYELQMALTNRRLEPEIETVFLMAGEANSFVSSRLVKEVARLGGDIGGFVPASVAARLRTRFAGQESRRNEI